MTPNRKFKKGKKQIEEGVHENIHV